MVDNGKETAMEEQGIMSLGAEAPTGMPQPSPEMPQQNSEELGAQALETAMSAATPKDWGGATLGAMVEQAPELGPEIEQVLALLQNAPPEAVMIMQKIVNTLIRAKSQEEYDQLLLGLETEFPGVSQLMPQEWDRGELLALRSVLDSTGIEGGNSLEETPEAPEVTQVMQGFAEGGLASLASQGRYGDTMLAHVNPQEVRMLKAMGGSGTINPMTGLPEFFLKEAWDWTKKNIINPIIDLGKKIVSHPVGRAVLGIVITVASAGALGPAGLGMSAGGAAAAGGAIAGASTAALAGESTENVIKSALTGGAGAYLVNEITPFVPGLEGTPDQIAAYNEAGTMSNMYTGAKGGLEGVYGKIVGEAGKEMIGDAYDTVMDYVWPDSTLGKVGSIVAIGTPLIEMLNEDQKASSDDLGSLGDQADQSYNEQAEQMRDEGMFEVDIGDVVTSPAPDFNIDVPDVPIEEIPDLTQPIQEPDTGEDTGGGAPDFTLPTYDPIDINPVFGDPSQNPFGAFDPSAGYGVDIPDDVFGTPQQAEEEQEEAVPMFAQGGIATVQHLATGGTPKSNIMTMDQYLKASSRLGAIPGKVSAKDYGYTADSVNVYDQYGSYAPIRLSGSALDRLKAQKEFEAFSAIRAKQNAETLVGRMQSVGRSGGDIQKAFETNIANLTPKGQSLYRNVFNSTYQKDPTKFMTTGQAAIYRQEQAFKAEQERLAAEQRRREQELTDAQRAQDEYNQLTQQERDYQNELLRQQEEINRLIEQISGIPQTEFPDEPTIGQQPDIGTPGTGTPGTGTPAPGTGTPAPVTGSPVEEIIGRQSNNIPTINLGDTRITGESQPVFNQPQQPPVNQGGMTPIISIPEVVQPTAPMQIPNFDSLPNDNPFAQQPFQQQGDVFGDPFNTQGQTSTFNMGGLASLSQGSDPRYFPRRTGPISGPGTGTSDDIPAMLSDGEFVFTAKAVRNAGGGDRRAGAKRMYQMMKSLEQGGSV